MKFLLIILLFSFAFESSSEVEDSTYPVRIISKTENKLKNSNLQFESNVPPSRNFSKKDLEIGSLLDNSYVLPEVDFQFDPVYDVLQKDSLMSSWDMEKIRDYNYEKQEKLHQFQESEKIKKFLEINFETQSPTFTDVDLEEESYNNRHLPVKIDPDFMKNNVFNFISQGNLQNLRLALEHHLDINYRDTQGRSLLNFAVISEKINLVRLLLARGANCHLSDRKNMKPIDHAKQQNNQEIFNLLKNFDCN